MKFATAYLENLYPNVCLRLSSKLTFFPRFVGEVIRITSVVSTIARVTIRV